MFCVQIVILMTTRIEYLRAVQKPLQTSFPITIPVVTLGSCRGLVREYFWGCGQGFWVWTLVRLAPSEISLSPVHEISGLHGRRCSEVDSSPLKTA
ncbi:hypothetical protein AVEN_230489-1 [Araneus ventricosus]|uniref:Uncharacterized protein n=1 Tax=Araneus ventricosus TaxID=182803 RepID=A0A4Y2IDY8_ARAVE|nr:hypothetical protein AVEN_230489-1 [Araneus ventricosus]